MEFWTAVFRFRFSPRTLAAQDFRAFVADGNPSYNIYILYFSLYCVNIIQAVFSFYFDKNLAKPEKRREIAKSASQFPARCIYF